VRTPLGSWDVRRRQKEAREKGALKSAPAPKDFPFTLPEPSCPKCGSDRTMITAQRSEYNFYECLKCRHKWRLLKRYEKGSREKKKERWSLFGKKKE
jgi:ssDNA-binding Zn-finger/Zn-ribbon topoisomerase 1